MKIDELASLDKIEEIAKEKLGLVYEDEIVFE